MYVDVCARNGDSGMEVYVGQAHQ